MDCIFFLHEGTCFDDPAFSGRLVRTAPKSGVLRARRAGAGLAFANNRSEVTLEACQSVRGSGART